MTKHLLAFALLAASLPALARPFLEAGEYPAGTLLSAAVTVNGAPSSIPCVIVTTATGAFPRCDLASLAPGGVYTLRMSVTGTPNCQNDARRQLGVALPSQAIFRSRSSCR
jgi:hypothetical protein